MDDLKELEERVRVLEQHRFELTEDQIVMLAERSAERAIEKIYANFGQGMLKKLTFWLGVAVFAVIVFFAGKGQLPKVP